MASSPLVLCSLFLVVFAGFVFSQVSVQTELNFNFANLVSKATVVPANSSNVAQVMFKIVALVDATGKLVASDPSVLQGYRAAISDLNAVAQKTNSRVSYYLYVADTQADPVKAVQMYQTYYAQGVRVFLGPSTSAELNALQPFSDNNGTIFLSPSSTTESLALTDNIFRATVSDNITASATGSYLVKNGFTNIISVYRSDVFGTQFNNVLVSQLAQLGAATPGQIEYQDSVLGVTIAQEIANFVTAQNAQHTIVVLASFGEWVSILQGAETIPLLKNVTWLGIQIDDGTTVPADVISSFRGNLYSTNFAIPNSDFQLEIQTELQGRGISTPSPEVYLAYDLALLAGFAFNFQRRDDNPSYKNNLIFWSKVLTGASGNLAMDSDGDRADLDIGFEMLLAQGFWQTTAVYDPTTSLFL